MSAVPPMADEALTLENPAAFPTRYHPDSHAGQGCAGMSLRDWFAGQSLTGSLAGGEYAISGGAEEHIAALAYNFADAMLRARVSK